MCSHFQNSTKKMHCQQSFFPGFIISRLFQSRTKRTIPRVPAHPRRRCRILASNIIICRYTPAGRVLLERRHTLCQQHGHLIAQQSACLLTTLSSIRFLPCHVIITTTTIITTAPVATTHHHTSTNLPHSTRISRAHAFSGPAVIRAVQVPSSPHQSHSPNDVVAYFACCTSTRERFSTYSTR